MGRLTGKVAIVTGGGRGIGRATVLRFTEEGASVVAADTDAAAAAATAAAAGQAGGTAAGFAFDAADEASWRELLDMTVSRFGGLDILVNNAAARVPVTIDEATLESWHQNFRVNSDGVFLGTKLGAEAMRDGGSIVNVASVAAFVALPESFPYAAAKASVVGMSRTAAVHFARQGRGIRVNVVAPGTVLTETIDEQLKKIASKPGGPTVTESINRMVQRVPLGRMSDPREVANAILFLASDEASFITGQHLLVDGGRTAQ
jgi:NAD(P)-dependent dehydrogenase (short-subunit alcohol dehydrogenase family)